MKVSKKSIGEYREEEYNSNFGEFSPIRSLNKKSSLHSSAVSYTPYLDYSNIKMAVPQNIGYMKAKEELDREKNKISRFREQLANSSKRTFIRSAQSALDDLKLVTTEIKNVSQTLPFLLPKSKPQIGISFDLPELNQQ